MVLSHYQIIKKSYRLVSKLANEIRLLRQINISITHCNTIYW